MEYSLKGHWGNRTNQDFLYQIAFDFITQLKQLMDDNKVTATELASRLDVSKGRVSQIMNNPGNLQLATVVDWARALGLKVGIVAYNDGDTGNDNGPINPEVFARCWEIAGRPRDFFEAGMAAASTGDPVDEALERNLRAVRLEQGLSARVEQGLSARATRRAPPWKVQIKALVVSGLKRSGEKQDASTNAA